MAERVLDGLGLVVACKVGHHDARAALLEELLLEEGDGLLGVAVDARVGDQDARRLDAVARPGAVLAEVVVEVLREDRAVERADGLDVAAVELGERGLHVLAELAHDAEVVTARLAVPGLVDVERAELAERIGREEHLGGRVVGEHDLGPMDERRGEEGELMRAEREGLAVLDDAAPAREPGAEVVLHHVEGADGADDLRLGIALGEDGQVRAMVGLHMLDDEVVGRAAVEDLLELAEPLVGEIGAHAVHDRDLLVHDDIGVVCHAVGHDVLALEEVELMVVHADVVDAVRDALHGYPPFSSITSHSNKDTAYPHGASMSIAAAASAWRSRKVGRNNMRRLRSRTRILVDGI